MCYWKKTWSAKNCRWCSKDQMCHTDLSGENACGWIDVIVEIQACDQNPAEINETEDS